MGRDADDALSAGTPLGPYTCFKEVGPGTHTVELLFAGCCRGAPVPGALAAYTGSPVLTLYHR